ncbi:MAG: hypothetical protein JWN51_1858 [Phycisphaerales bacterium]|nr:hypothetical protein [Phycisphaerales bacterium]
MVQILNEHSLREALRMERAVIVCHVDWSIHSVLTTKLVEQWEQNWLRGGGLRPVRAYRVIPESQPKVQEWLMAEGLASIIVAGAGEVLWLEYGRVVAKLLSGVTESGLVQTTQGLWAGRLADAVNSLIYACEND